MTPPSLTELELLRRIGDPLADRAVAALFSELSWRHKENLLGTSLLNNMRT
jgi:hypothetical protein